ncbi:MAG: 30S ribosomal protein S19 [Nanoarchaeota archaeon]|nr:30S ribosomal protein S19 [Nanoarchaeota archaeon]
MHKKKEFTYRGKTLEELKQLNAKELAKCLKSKDRRYLLRNSQEIERFVKRIRKKLDKNKKIRTHKRDMIILPEMVGINIQVHNGKDFTPVEIIGEMIGHRLGEFALTRSKVTHTKAGVGATKGTKHQAKK